MGHVIRYPQIFLIFLIIFSPLPYGSVNTLSFTIIESIIFLLILIWLLEMTYNKKLIFIKTDLIFPLTAILFLIILQLIYLPESLIGILGSPKTIHLYKSLLPIEFSKRNLFTLSIYPKETVIELFKLLSNILILYLILNKISSKRQFNHIINTIIFFGFFISLFGIIQKFTYSGKVYWFDPKGSALYPFGPFINKNHFAGYMEMVIPLTLGYCLLDMQLSKRVFYGFLAATMSLSLFLSLSRGGIVAFTGILIFMFLFSITRGQFKKESLILFLLLILVLSLFLFLVGPKPVIDRLSTLFSKGSPIGRGYFLPDGLRILKDFPIFGTGLGTFGSISPMYKTTPDQAFYKYAHNDYLQLILEIGIFGFLLIFLFFFLYFRSVLKMWFRREDSYVRSMTLGGMGAVFGILLHSLVDFNLHIPSNALLFFIILGLTYRLVFTSFKGSEYIESWQKELNLKSSFIISISFVIIFLFFEYILFNGVFSERIFNKAMKTSEKAKDTKAELVVERSILYQKALRLLERAIKLDPRDSRYHFEYANILTDLALDKNLTLISDFKDEREVYSLARSKYLDAINFEPTKAIYHLKLGWINSLILGEDEIELEKAVLLDPQNLNIHLYLSKYYLSKDRQTDFLRHINKAIKLQKVITGGPVVGEVSLFLQSIGREDLIKE